MYQLISRKILLVYTCWTSPPPCLNFIGLLLCKQHSIHQVLDEAISCKNKKTFLNYMQSMQSMNLACLNWQLEPPKRSHNLASVDYLLTFYLYVFLLMLWGTWKSFDDIWNAKQLWRTKKPKPNQEEVSFIFSSFSIVTYGFWWMLSL